MTDQNSSFQGSSFKVRVFTLFPELFPGVLGASVTGRAMKEDLWSLDTINIRDFAHGKHAQVDDTPCGGGAGMVIRADVVDVALKSVFDNSDCSKKDSVEKISETKKPKIIYVSPRGIPFTQDLAKQFAKESELNIICGRFEGIDQRVLDAWDVQEVSLGDFVLSGGEIAAQAIIDASLRMIPGVLGAHESLDEESFSSGLLEYPHFTRPREWNDCNVPQVLLSGNHKEIAKWRRSQSEALTKERRPDLWKAYKAKEKTMKNQAD